MSATRSKSRPATNGTPLKATTTLQRKSKGRSRTKSRADSVPKGKSFSSGEGKGKTKVEEVVEKSGEEVYCICRGVDDGSPMIYCCQCEDWYHFKCVELSIDKAEEIAIFVCPDCTTRTGRKTTMDWEGPNALEEGALAEASIPVEAELEDEPIDEDEPIVSESEVGSGDEYVAEEPSKSMKVRSSSVSSDDSVVLGRKRRSIRRLSVTSASDDDGAPRSRLRRARVTPDPVSNLPSSPDPRESRRKRKSISDVAPPSKRSKSEVQADAADDPARKYCLGKLQDLFEDIFLRYPFAGDAERDGAEASEDVKEERRQAAKAFSAEIEQCQFELYAEPDKTGKLSASGKYKERFRMLQFNLSQKDRVAVHKRIAALRISAKELSTMTSTDLANEEMKESIKIAEKEALEQAILTKTTAPRAKITHKGLQDIEDVNGTVGAAVSLEQERGREDEEKRERERMARLRPTQRQTSISQLSIPPESPITSSQVPGWGAPLPETPTTAKFSINSEPAPAELNLADLINIDEDSGQTSVAQESSVIPSILAVDLPAAPASPTVAKAIHSPTTMNSNSTPQSLPETPTRSSFNLNSLWSAPRDNASPTPSSLPDDKDTVLGMEIVGEPADDNDFDMFLEKEEVDVAKPTTTEEVVDNAQSLFEALPQVWKGLINMPLESGVPQETPVVARQMGGRSIDPSSPLWQTLFPSAILRVDGRVPVDKSAQFLLQTRMNSAKELISVAFTPSSSEASAGFGALSDFLIKKSRHGLIFPWGTRPKEHDPGKELYVVPLLSTEPLPDFIELLDELRLPKTRSADYLVGIWILNKGKLAPPLPAAPPTPFITPTAPPTNPALPNAFPPGIAPTALAAEMASLTPEQIQLMIQTLASATAGTGFNLPTASIVPPTPPPQNMPAPQWHPSSFPPFPPTGPSAPGHRPPFTPLLQSPAHQPLQDQLHPGRRDNERERGNRFGSELDRAADDGWRGFNQRGRGRGRGGFGRDDGQRKSSWGPRRDGGPSSPTQGLGRWGGGN